MKIVCRREIKFKREAFGTLVINRTMLPFEVPDWASRTPEFESHVKSGDLVVIGATTTPIKRLDKEQSNAIKTKRMN